MDMHLTVSLHLKCTQGDQGLKGKGNIRKYFSKIKEENLPYIADFTGIFLPLPPPHLYLFL